MRYNGKIEKLNHIIVSDPSYDKDVTCRYEKTGMNEKDWKIDIDIENVEDRYGKYTFKGTEFYIFLVKDRINAELRYKGTIKCLSSIKIKETEIGMDTACVAFGINEKADIKKRVENAAEILGLTEYLKRKPAALSGGQRQRVALGRAIVRDAKVFLMDEPLSNLDAKLRVAMRAEIAKLHQRLETTTIYVTHDQTEAMTMADRIVIMKDGFIQQIGTPKEVYDTPVNMFVAGFIGSPAMNFFNVTLNNGVISDGHGLKLKIPEGKNKVLVEKGYEGKEVVFGIRPEDIHSEQVVLEAQPEAVVHSEVVVSELLGAETMLYTRTGTTEFISKVDARDFHKPGEMVDLAFNISKGHFFDKSTEEVIGLP